jgi:ERCC4-type nuclease
MKQISIFVVPTELDLLNAFAENGVVVVQESMDVGDIQIRSKDASSDSDEWIVEAIIERKAKTDLESSLTDGRYRDQKDRMLLIRQSHPSVRLVYLIEQLKISPNKKKSVWAAITNSSVKTGFTIFQTTSLSQSVEFIESYRYSISKQYEEAGSETQQLNLKVVDTQIKKKKVTPEDFFKHSLNLIPGVQDSVSEAIAEKFGGMAELYKQLSSTPSPKTLLKDIPRSRGTSTKTMKIGPVLSERICEYILKLNSATNSINN